MEKGIWSPEVHLKPVCLGTNLCLQYTTSCIQVKKIWLWENGSDTTAHVRKNRSISEVTQCFGNLGACVQT